MAQVVQNNPGSFHVKRHVHCGVDQHFGRRSFQYKESRDILIRIEGKSGVQERSAYSLVMSNLLGSAFEVVRPADAEPIGDKEMFTANVPIGAGPGVCVGLVVVQV